MYKRQYLDCQRGSLIQFQQDTIAIGQVSGRVINVDVSTPTAIVLEVDCDCTFFQDPSYAIRVRLSTGQQEVINVMFADSDSFPITTRRLKAAVTKENDKLRSVSVGDLFAFGERTKETAPLVVVDVRPKDETTATLECVAYDSDLYNVGVVPEFDSYVTDPPLLDRNRLVPIYDIDQLQSDAELSGVLVNVDPPPASILAIERISFQWRKYVDTSISGAIANSWGTGSSGDGGDALGFLDTDKGAYLIMREVIKPQNISDFMTAKAHVDADPPTYSEDFTYEIRGRYEFTNDPGKWGTTIRHTPTCLLYTSPSPRD